MISFLATNNSTAILKEYIFPNRSRHAVEFSHTGSALNNRHNN